MKNIQTNGRRTEGQRPAAIDDGRRGTVLVLIVGILAVLMLLAATLALVTRMELKTSGYYEDSQSAELIVDNLEQYCKYILHRDKFGSDGWPYNYERLEASGSWTPGDDYPTGNDRATTSGGNFVFNGDDEGFDSLQTEEWLPPATGSGETWRLFNPDSAGGQNDAALIDTNNDGLVEDATDQHYARWLDMSQALGANYGSLLGGNMQARFALRFIDLGGSRVDINATGRPFGATGGPHGGYLYLHYCAADGPPPAATTQITGQVSDAEATIRVSSSNGSQGTLWVEPIAPFLSFVPGEEITDAGGTWSAIVSVPFSTPGLSACEIDPRQTIKALLRSAPLNQAESAARSASDNRFENFVLPAKYGNTSPGTNGDDPDVARASDALDYNYNGIVDDNTQPINDYQNVPTEFSGVWPWGDDRPFSTMDLHDLFWGRNRGSRAATLLDLVDPQLNPDPQEIQNLGYDLNSNLTAFTTDSGGTVIVSRSTLNQEDWDDTNTDATAGQSFFNVPFALDTTNSPQSPTTQQALPVARPLDKLMRQANGDPIAPADMADLLVQLGIRDSSGPLTASDMKTRQIALNICEMLDDDFGPRQWSPGPNKDYVGMEPVPYLVEIEAAVRCDTENGGPGKFIKLVNPWNVPIPLENYELYLPATTPDGIDRLREWLQFNNPNNNALNWFSVPYNVDITIDFDAGDVIPPRGHFLVVDDASTFNELPTDAYKEAGLSGGRSKLSYMQECEGPPTGTHSTYHDWFEDPPQGGPGGGISNIPPWAQAHGVWNNMPARIRNRLNAQAGEASVVRLRYNGQVLQEVTIPDDPSEDDNDGLTLPSISAQVSDPRPCWTDVSQTDPWRDDHWDANDTTTRYEEGTTTDAWTENSTDLAYFNRSWRYDPAQPNEKTQGVGGDGWFLLYAADDGDPPQNQDNLLESFPPVMRKPDPAIDEWTTGVWNTPRLVNPTYLGYVHSGEPWETISLRPGEGIWLSRLLDYTVPANGSPYEDGIDNDGDATDLITTGTGSPPPDGQIDSNPNWQVPRAVDAQDIDVAPHDGVIDGTENNPLTDRNGPEIRVHGRINVNTAPEAVIRAVLNRDELLRWATEVETNTADVQSEADDVAQTIAEAIVEEREEDSGSDTDGDGYGPFTSVADLFERVEELWGDGLLDTNRNEFRTNQCEALARFMAGLVTVRTDVWGVVGRVQLWQDQDNNGVLDLEQPGADPDGDGTAGENEIQAERRFYMVLDRSRDPIKVIMKRYLPD